MKIAVTGGNGELGRHLTPHLIDQGHEVISIDLTLPRDIPPVPDPSLQFLAANITNFGDVVGSIQGCEAIIHLAAHRAPWNNPNHVVYLENTTNSYNVLLAAASLGIKRVCLASSINAIGGVFSRWPRYDYFPVDEQHPTYAEDPYSLSKWVLEQQGDAFARRYEDMSIASLRFHWLLESRERAIEVNQKFDFVKKHLWAYTLLKDAVHACLLAITADFQGHEAFYIVAPRTAVSPPSRELAQQHFPDTPIRGDFSGNSGFFDCSKAERILNWQHEA